MNDIHETLTKELLDKNDKLSYAQARAWVELLWEDFQTTYAKSGRYQGDEMTEQVVRTWINNLEVAFMKCVQIIRNIAI